MDASVNTKLKDEILHKVFKDNRQLRENDGRGISNAKRYRRNRHFARLLAVVLLAALLITSRFFVFPILFGEEPQLAETTPMTSLPWSDLVTRKGHEVNSPVPLLIDTSRDKLLNYSMLLNDERVRVSSVFGLDVKTIVIDSGHGGRDPGAVGSLGTFEKDIVLDVGLRLRALLSESGRYKILMTRDSDVFISLSDRVRFANDNRADLFISLHVNALPQKNYNLVETFYFDPPQDKYVLRLAEQENRGSEIKVGDFKSMVEKIGSTMKTQESALLAASIQKNLFANLSKDNKSIFNHGTKTAPFIVLLGVDAPSVLVEISAISKKGEEINLQKPEYRNRITKSIRDGIVFYLENKILHIVDGESNGQSKNRSRKEES
jgi:N-acetylmuramoyl-L-alanine amidase